MSHIRAVSGLHVGIICGGAGRSRHAESAGRPQTVPPQFGIDGLLHPEMAEVRKTTPVIMGEFGAFDFHEKTFAAAVDSIVQARDLANKEKVNGMLFWTYDCQEQLRLYHATDDWDLFYKKMGTFEP
jgi:hypothetical protein